MTTCDSNSNLPQDPLDECLKNARWPEPTGLQRTRLEARWELLARERARSRRRLMRWTLAASILLAIGTGWGGWLLWNPGQPDGIPPVNNITQPRMAEKPEPEVERPSATLSLVRPPTSYEQVAFRVMAQRRQLARVNRQPLPLLQALNNILEQPEADVSELCLPLQSQRAAYENLILSQIGSWNLPEQRAAMKILEEIGSPRAIPVLDLLSRDPEFAKLAWPVALQLAPARLLGQWAKTDSPAHRKEAIQTLLSRREDAKAVSEFLRLVALPDSRNLAIEVIKAEPNPPVEELFACLKQGTKEQRHTAGLVLGRIATPSMTGQLLALAKEEAFPPEVMIALLNSSDQQAARFLNQAKRNPQARMAVQLAFLEWELISSTSSLLNPLEIH